MITNLITSRDDYSLAKHPKLMTGGEHDAEYYDGMSQKIARLPIKHVLDMVEANTDMGRGAAGKTTFRRTC